MSPVLADPVRDGAERLRLQPAGAPLRLTTLFDETGPLQHLEVLRDSGQAHVERRRELCDRRLTAGEAGQGAPFPRVRAGGRRDAQGGGLPPSVLLVGHLTSSRRPAARAVLR